MILIAHYVWTGSKKDEKEEEKMNDKKYLKWYQKLAYGSGDLASNCSYGLVSSFLLLYLSDIMGLKTSIIGTLMLVSKIFDGVTDVFFGNMIDRTKSRLGKARPWMLYAQIGVSLCLVLLFSIPNMGQTAQYAYFFAFYTCLNAIFYTANGVAYSTLSALITNNPQERVQLGSIRFMFAVVTNIVMGFAVTGGVEAFGGGAAGWRAVAIICALIGLVVNTISCLAVKEVEPDESVRKTDESKPQDDKLGFWESMKFLFTNKYYVLILVLYIVYYIMSNITTGSGVYFTKYVLGDASLLGMFQMMKMFPVIIALIFTPMLVKKTGSMQKVNFWGYAINCVLSVFFIYFAYQRNVKLMLLFMFIKGIFAGTLSGTLNALIAEISGYTYRTKDGWNNVQLFFFRYQDRRWNRNCSSGLAVRLRRLYRNCSRADRRCDQYDLCYVYRDSGNTQCCYYSDSWTVKCGESKQKMG